MSSGQHVFDSTQLILGQEVLWREIIGNGFGLASAIGGMRRRVWAWPVGIVGNVILFTVFLGMVFYNPQHTTLLGQAGRQVFFIATSAYGWWRWRQQQRLNEREQTPQAPAIVPRWATSRERMTLVLGWIAGVVVCQWVFAVIGAGAPRWYFWCDAWIFVGSFVATYAMARGWNDFWLAWIAVDVVGVPLAIHSHFYATAVYFAIYGVFIVYGFVVWLRASRTEAPDIEPEEARA